MSAVDDAIRAAFPPTPEQKAAYAELNEAIAAYQRDTVAMLRFWAPVICSCDRRYIWGQPAPPQASCVVHGQLLLDENGKAVL
jgi:hypothetical protein